MLTFKEVSQENYNVRNSNDRRKKENNLVITYLDNEGIEYRKRFCFPVDMNFDKMFATIPKTI